jgi:hypothetical protein
MERSDINCKAELTLDNFKLKIVKGLIRTYNLRFL